jgi:hypothetical protein
MSVSLALVSPVVSVLCGLLAILAVFDQAWEYVYGWLGVAALAHLAEFVRSADAPDYEAPSSGDGDVGDLESVRLEGVSAIAAFLVFVFVPIVAMLHAGFLDGVAGTVLAVLILLSALYRWAYVRADDDGVVHGLPACWSILGFLLHAFDTTPPVAVLCIGAALVLSLVPVALPHPLIEARSSLIAGVIFAAAVVAAAATLWAGFPAMWQARAVFLGIAVYLIVLTVLRSRAVTQNRS